jgi:hypothetical protein
MATSRRARAFPFPAEPEDRKAAEVTRVLAETKSDEFSSLVESIAELREPRRGPPELWVRRLRDWPGEWLAAAILYHLTRARLWIEPHDHADSPYLLTIGTALGVDLLGLETADRDEPGVIGCQLLGIAKRVGIIALPQAEGRRGRRVVLTERTFGRLQQIIKGGAAHVLRRVRTEPPTGVRTKKPYRMQLDRPPAPPRVVAAADKIQGTPWRINRAVLKYLDAPLGRISRQDWRRRQQRKRILREARELATLERFYFPVFTDFRGRIYQRGGVLTYTGGDDYARGLLEFADGESLDKDGVGWLTWHMAQMWGRQEDWPKGANGRPYLPLGDGTAWLDDGVKLIGRWQDAKHPAQFLAAALAVADASEGRPVHLPVRVDASCSALQHLALLTRDENLARSVKLWGNYDLTGRRGVSDDHDDDPSDDFYQRVAEETGFERSHVKAVIVPTLYGAGWKTSAEGLLKKRNKKRLSKSQIEDANKIRDAAKRLAPRAFGLLKWFAEVAEAHNQRDLPVRWTAPSGFQVIQDPRVVKHAKNPEQVKVRIDGEFVNLVKRVRSEFICKWKQPISAPPNIVHSLDAALLTEIVAGSGIDQWGVIHDAFGVPANRVWELLDQDNPRAIRALYEADRLAEWVAAWRADGAPMERSAELLGTIVGSDAQGPLPAEMLGGLRTLG